MTEIRWFSGCQDRCLPCQGADSVHFRHLVEKHSERSRFVVPNLASLTAFMAMGIRYIKDGLTKDQFVTFINTEYKPKVAQFDAQYNNYMASLKR